jgi:hypothetical protein
MLTTRKRLAILASIAVAGLGTGCGDSNLQRTYEWVVEIQGAGSLIGDSSVGVGCSATRCTISHTPTLLNDQGHMICASPSAGQRFDHWEGACLQEGKRTTSCLTLGLIGNASCVAVFVPM